MPTHRLLQVDAFTTRPLEGNPCAVVLEADDLDEERMLAIAREMNLSETAFVTGSGVADVGARYFTPAEEIPLAGHPTIATVQALLDTGGWREEDAAITIELVEGPIEVEIRPGEPGRPRIVMTQRRPVFGAEYDPAEVLPAFGLEPADALDDAPIQTVSTGTPQLMVPLRDLAAVRRATLDVTRYGALKERGDFFSPHLFCLEGATPGGRTFARHFGLPPDTFEDPFTGSATGGMAAWLWRHGRLDAPEFVAEQGHGLGRPGRAFVEIVGPRDAIEAVRVGGHAVTVFEGELAL